MLLARARTLSSYYFTRNCCKALRVFPGAYLEKILKRVNQHLDLKHRPIFLAFFEGDEICRERPNIHKLYGEISLFQGNSV